MAKPLHAAVQVTGDHAEPTKDFLRLLSRVASREGYTEYEVFQFWLQAAFHALYGRVLRLMKTANIEGAAEKFDANEERYMRIVKNYKKSPSESMTDMATMLAIITGALKNNPRDFLSPIFMEIATNKHLGQFFTPYEVSMVSARMIIQNAGEMLAAAKLQGRDYISLMEPACGVGGMALAANEVLTEQGIDIAADAHWVAVDLDFKAVCGTYIQLTLTGASASVVHGNALSMEEKAAYPTLAAVMFPKRVVPPPLKVRHRSLPSAPPAALQETPSMGVRVRQRPAAKPASSPDREAA